MCVNGEEFSGKIHIFFVILYYEMDNTNFYDYIFPLGYGVDERML